MKTAIHINQQVVLALTITFLLILLAQAVIKPNRGVYGNHDNSISFAPFSAPVEVKPGKWDTPRTASSVIVKVTRYPLSSGHGNELNKALDDYVTAALAQKDNLMAEAYLDRENPDILWLIERWNDQSSYDSFLKTGSSKSLASLIPQLTKGPTETKTYQDLEPQSRQAWRKQPDPEDQPFTVMLFVDAMTGTQDEFIRRYHVAMPKFRGEKGVVTYGLSQNIEDPTKFITYEKFRGEEGFQYHLKFEPVKPVLDFLDHSIKSPPFQKGIHNLILFSPGH